MSNREEVRTPRRGVADFARSVHASYLSRWAKHDPDGMERVKRSDQRPERLPDGFVRRRAAS